MRIKFFSSFCDSAHCKEKFEALCESHLIDYYGKDKKIYFTSNDDYTHVIIINTAMPNLNIPKENVIGFAFEPPHFLGITTQFIEYAQRHIGKYFIGQTMGLPSPPFIEDYSYMWHIMPMTIFPPKKKFMSIMCSEKNFAPGHKYRHELVWAILNSKFPIDIYGRGTIYYSSSGSIYQNDSRICGKFIEKEPFEDYEYTIAIENYQTTSYISEKLLTPLLCGTNTLYWGATNVHEKFGENKDAIKILTGDLNTDMLMIQKMCENRVPPVKINMINDKINLIKNLDTIFMPANEI